MDEGNDRNGTEFIYKNSNPSNLSTLNGTNHAIGTTVAVDVNNQPSLPTEEGMQEAPLFITLGHELGHAFRTAKGINDESLWDSFVSSTITKDELYASMYENFIRNEHGIPLRTHYATKVGWQGIGYGEMADDNFKLFKSITPVNLSKESTEPDIIVYEYIRFHNSKGNK